MFVWDEWPSFFRGRWRLMYALTGELPVRMPLDGTARDDAEMDNSLDNSSPEIGSRGTEFPGALFRNTASGR
jgi:hypothetical protein